MSSYSDTSLHKSNAQDIKTSYSSGPGLDERQYSDMPQLTAENSSLQEPVVISSNKLSFSTGRQSIMSEMPPLIADYIVSGNSQNLKTSVSHVTRSVKEKHVACDGLADGGDCEMPPLIVDHWETPVSGSITPTKQFHQSGNLSSIYRSDSRSSISDYESSSHQSRPSVFVKNQNFSLPNEKGAASCLESKGSSSAHSSPSSLKGVNTGAKNQGRKVSLGRGKQQLLSLMETETHGCSLQHSPRSSFSESSSQTSLPELIRSPSLSASDPSTWGQGARPKRSKLTSPTHSSSSSCDGKSKENSKNVNISDGESLLGLNKDLNLYSSTGTKSSNIENL